MEVAVSVLTPPACRNNDVRAAGAVLVDAERREEAGRDKCRETERRNTMMNESVQLIETEENSAGQERRSGVEWEVNNRWGERSRTGRWPITYK